ncbi:hypothetical protein TNCV_417871 [Trichonephila clavipes]|nr:hypothetical protein TNCV_417871 [Trichonephila clavipes]
MGHYKDLDLHSTHGRKRLRSEVGVVVHKSIGLNRHALTQLFELLLQRSTRGLLARDHVILNHGQVTWMTPEQSPPLLTTTPTGGR